jgi:hypothetical protein
MAFPPPNNGSPRQSLPIPASTQWSGMTHSSGDPTGRSFPRQSSFQAVRWANSNSSLAAGLGGSAGPVDVNNAMGTEASYAQGYVRQSLIEPH